MMNKDSIDVATLYSSCSYAESQLAVSKVELKIAKENNEKFKELKVKSDEVNALYNEITEFLNVLTTYDKVVQTEDSNYKQRRLNFLASYIDKHLLEVFPEEGFSTNISCDFKNKTLKSYLTLKDKNGRTTVPYIGEGKLCQELISFSAALAMVECLDSDRLYMDEAFAASSPENLTKIGKLIRNACESGFQILLIEQKDDIYKDLPRREIRIAKDPIDKRVCLTEIIDF